MKRWAKSAHKAGFISAKKWVTSSPELASRTRAEVLVLRGSVRAIGSVLLVNWTAISAGHADVRVAARNTGRKSDESFWRF
jgi:hypothetical protein